MSDTEKRYSISGTVQAYNAQNAIELIPDQENTVTINGEKYAVFFNENDMEHALLFQYKKFIQIQLSGFHCPFRPLQNCHVKVCLDIQKSNDEENHYSNVFPDEYISSKKSDIIMLNR